MPVPAPPDSRNGPFHARSDVAALLRVQEHPPRLEVAVLDRPSQLLVVFDERELEARGGVLKGGGERGVRVRCGRDRYVIDRERLLHGIDTLAGAQVDECDPLPPRHESSQLHDLVGVRALEGQFGHFLIQPEVADERPGR